jgi:Domain of unknown function (DUF4167)
MKQNNNNNRRARGRGPRKPHGMGGGGHNKGQGYDGGGQELRVRGNAYQVLEKYLQLARDAGSAGDRVAAENFLQHADHYYRVLSAMNDGQRPRMGGRELSVADVNVQNVSQGLSAALYSSGGANPQGGSDSGMQGDGMPGQNPGNQGNQGSQGNQGHGAQQGQGGHRQDRQDRQGGHQQGGQQHGHQQGGRSHEAQHQQPSGNVAQTNGHGSNYDNYADREETQPSYPAPSEPPRAAAPVPAEDQPDYPEELLPGAAPAVPAAPQAPDDAEDGVQRTLRAPRPRLRGPRRGPRQGDGRQGGGSGQADPE